MKQEHSEQKKADEKTRRDAIFQQYLQKKAEAAEEGVAAPRRQPLPGNRTARLVSRPKSQPPGEDKASHSSSHSSQEELCLHGRSPVLDLKRRWSLFFVFFLVTVTSERRGCVVVRTTAWHAIVRGSIPGPGMLYYRRKHGSSVVGAPLRNFSTFVYPHIDWVFRMRHYMHLMCKLSWTRHSSLEKGNSLKKNTPVLTLEWVVWSI